MLRFANGSTRYKSIFIRICMQRRSGRTSLARNKRIFFEGRSMSCSGRNQCLEGVNFQPQTQDY